MKAELEWEFIGVWPLFGDYYFFEWRTYCGQFLITGAFYGDGKPVFECYAMGKISWERVGKVWTWETLEGAKVWLEHYAKGLVK